MMTLSPSLELRDQDPHYNKMSRKLMHLFKFEKPHPRSLSFSFTETWSKKEANETSHFLSSVSRDHYGTLEGSLCHHLHHHLTQWSLT